MKRLQSIIITILGVGFVANAQLTAKQVFIEAPVNVLPTISEIARLDMIDYYESGIAKPTPSLFDDDVIVTDISDNKLSATTSAASSIDFYVTSAGNDSLIIVVETVSLPAPDSKAYIYDRQWKLVDSIDSGLLKDWYTAEVGNTIKKEDMENTLGFITAAAQFDTSSNTLSFTPTVAETIIAEDYQKISSGLKPKLQYKISSKGFKQTVSK